MRILLVDDDDAFRSGLRMVLQSEECEVIDVDSGEAAVEVLGSGRFDVILLDYKMPGITGLNVLQWMLEQKLETPVVMLTAAGNEFVAAEAMKLGAYDYIRKESVDIDHLPIVVHGVYERSLFKQEKAIRAKEERKREEARKTAETLGAAATSIGRHMAQTLSIISLKLGECDDDFKSSILPEKAQSFSEAANFIKSQFDVISSGVASLVGLYRVASQNIAADSIPPQSDDRIEEIIERLQVMKDQVARDNGPKPLRYQD